MQPWLKLCWQGTRFCGACLLSFCLWTFWLALTVLLVFQLYIATARELAVPPFLLRALEERLAASGVKASFGRASFDPSGIVLIEKMQLRLPTFEDPALTADTVTFTLDPWLIAVGRFEPRELRASGVSLRVPAMLSPTGRNERLLEDVDFTVIPQGREYLLPHFTGRLAALQFSARGALNHTPLQRGPSAPLLLPDLLARHYPAICQQLVALGDALTGLEEPRLSLLLTPSETRGAVVSVDFLARKLDLAPRHPAVLSGLHATTRLPLLGEAAVPLRVAVTADSLQAPAGITARRLHALVQGRAAPGRAGFIFEQLEVSAATLAGKELAATGVALQLHPGPLSGFSVEMSGRVLDEPITFTGTIDPTTQSAQGDLAGRFAPGLLDLLGRRLGQDLRPFVNFAHSPTFDLTGGFAPGWKFAGVSGHVAARGVTAYRVTLDTLAGHIAFDGRHLRATQARAQLGTNFARGSFEQDFRSREFRFLLDGRLDPIDISGWFREWWPNFWRSFDFSRGAPVANVDVHGWWGQGPRTTVFVLADATRPVIRGVALDHTITRLFVRPNFYDALEVFVTHGAGAARGTFSRASAARDSPVVRTTFDFDSTLELAAVAGLVGPEVAAIIEPFRFTQSPALQARGYVDAATSAQGGHREVHVAGHTPGSFTFHKFPLQHLSFSAHLRDDVLTVTPVEVGFAGGITQGKIMINGPTDRQQLGFDLSIKAANLRDAVMTLEKFIAQRRGTPPPVTGAYIDGTANVSMDMDISASGDLADHYSYSGSGHTELTGQGLGKIRLLGLLSELLNFTALSFDSLKADFTIERSRLVFPEVNLTGPNAAISAHGHYLLTEKELDFNARVYPFQESKFILKTVVGAVLTPLSTVLEVKLGGNLDKPSWAFVIGPTNFFRSLLSAPTIRGTPETETGAPTADPPPPLPSQP